MGFCGADGSGFSPSQPPSHLERWALPYDNGTHLVVDWRADRSVCGRNVSSYLVDVRTSSSVLNLVVGLFGVFPQDVCAPTSKARSSVEVDNSKALASACQPYPRNCHELPRRSAVPISPVLRWLSRLEIEVTVIATGSHAPVQALARRTRTT